MDKEARKMYIFGPTEKQKSAVDREKQRLIVFNPVTWHGDPLTLDLWPRDHGGSLPL